MMYYARSDTHYLLYIYDRIRNDLIAASDRSDPERDFLGRTLEKSRELSLSRHEHPGFDEETGQGSRGWYNYILKNSHFALSSEQFAVFRALWSWRDEVARTEDESPNFVLSTHHITEIARVNPPDAKAVHSMLPLGAALAKSRVSGAWEKIQAEKAKGGPTLLQWLTSQRTTDVSKKELAFTTKQTSSVPGTDGVVAVDCLARSQLFGAMPISSRWEESKEDTRGQEATFPFPWQKFVSEASIDVIPAVEAAPTPVEEAPKTADVPEPALAVDEEFTLRSRGTKRKSDAVEQQSSDESEDEEADGDSDVGNDSGIIAIDDEAPSARSSKRARKERKKDRKAAKAQQEDEEKLRRQQAKAERKARQKAKKAKDKDDGAKKYETVPFDYTQATPVMNANKNNSAPRLAQAKKAFDPYSKTGDDEIKGARKAPPVRGEKSATFKK
jgi:exosome complex exonuclease RRP6